MYPIRKITQEKTKRSKRIIYGINKDAKNATYLLTIKMMILT